MELFLKETEADLAFLARTGCYNCRSCRSRKLERFNVIFIGTGSWKPLSPVFFVPICFAIIVDVEIEWKCFANIEAFVLKNGIYFFSSRFLLSMWNEAFEVPPIMEQYLGIWFVFWKLLATIHMGNSDVSFQKIAGLDQKLRSPIYWSGPEPKILRDHCPDYNNNKSISWITFSNESFALRAFSFNFFRRICLKNICKRKIPKLTFENGRNLEHPKPTDRKHLPESQLHEEHGDAGENKCDEVWYKESAAAIFITQIGETPHVTETDRETDNWKDKV